VECHGYVLYFYLYTEHCQAVERLQPDTALDGIRVAQCDAIENITTSESREPEEDGRHLLSPVMIIR
jgi:hypothetical protein